MRVRPLLNGRCRTPHARCFLFSGSRRHTRWPRDWSSDVCSSDLSNPYLDAVLANRNASHPPQWIVIDLGRSAPIDTLRVHWAEPYAIQFRVEYWRGNGMRSEERRVGKGRRSGGWSEDS